MHIDVVTRSLFRRWRLRSREVWTESSLAAHQAQATEDLRAFAVDRSPFYREVHRGLVAEPLHELPVLTKSILMDEFDRISTAPSLHLGDVKRSLDELPPDGRLRRKYWVTASSGTSGRRTILAADAFEWSTIVASYLRALEWAGVEARLGATLRIAIVSSTTPWHPTARVAATIDSPLLRTLAIDARAEVAETVSSLNHFQPDVLVAYASMMDALASEQVRGKLSIAPRSLVSFAEVLTADERRRAEEAFQAPVFQFYSTAETGVIAAECSFHRGMHVFEDLFVTENVDENAHPVAVGTIGDRLLVTALSSRTLPLIRYELTDRVRIAPDRCPCGRPFKLISEIEGRTDEVLRLEGRGTSTVDVHPVVFHRVLDARYGSGWQVRQRGARLEVLVTGPDSEAAHSLRHELDEAGVGAVPLDVRAVSTIPAGSAGKRPFVVVLERRSP